MPARPQTSFQRVAFTALHCARRCNIACTRLRRADLLRPAHLTWPILRVSHLVDGFLWGTCTTKAVGCTRKLKPFCKLMCIRCCTLFLRMGGPDGLRA